MDERIPKKKARKVADDDAIRRSDENKPNRKSVVCFYETQELHYDQRNSAHVIYAQDEPEKAKIKVKADLLHCCST